MKLRIYQETAVAFIAKSKRGLVEAPAGSGKTIIAAAGIARVLEMRQRPEKAFIEIMVNTAEQVGQFEVALNLFPVIARNSDTKVYCAAGAPPGTDPDLLVVDECHHAAARTWRKKIESAHKARWAFSATPFSNDETRNDIIRRLFGNRIHAVERDALVDAGHIAPAKVLWHAVHCERAAEAIKALSNELIETRKAKKPYLFRTAEGADKQNRQCVWQAVRKIGIAGNEAIDALIIAEATSRIKAGGSIIILIGEIEHGRRLLDMIPGAELCFSNMGRRKRAETIAGFKSGQIPCVIGTKLLDEGFDAPIADCLIVARGGKSTRESVQATGRVLRKFDGKAHGTIIDFEDTTHGILKCQARKRREIYAELSYKQTTATPTPFPRN